MATAVLRSEDCLNGRFHQEAFASRAPPPRRRNPDRPSPPSSKSSPHRPTQGVRRSSPVIGPKANRAGPPIAVKKPTSGSPAARRSQPMMGEIRILKRGEDLASAVPYTELSGCGADGATVFAGPAFFTSPEPSSLPLPEFFLRKIADKIEATKALRGLLRLPVSP